MDNTIPTRTVRFFPSNKRRISSDLKELLNKKKKSLQGGRRESLRSAQKELKVNIRDNKEVYRRKLENKLQHNNMQDVWSGMKKITGFKQKEDQRDGSLDRANVSNHIRRCCPPPPPVCLSQ